MDLFNDLDSSEILFCGAFSGEIDLLKTKTKLKLLEVGVGSLLSAVILQEYLAKNKIKLVIFVGSAGLYFSKNLKLNEKILGISNHFYSLELGSFSGEVTYPKIQVTESKSKISLQNFKNSKFLIGNTNSTSGITTKNLLAKEINILQEKKILFENLETFGLSVVCNRYKIPFVSMFAITNLVGKNGSKEWKKYWRERSIFLQNEIINLFF